MHNLSFQIILVWREFINCDQKLPIDGDDEVSNTKLFLATSSGQHAEEPAMQYENYPEVKVFSNKSLVAGRRFYQIYRT